MLGSRPYLTSAGERISIVEDVEGVTRDRIYTSAEWLNRQFSLIDTGGNTISMPHSWNRLSTKLVLP